MIAGFSRKDRTKPAGDERTNSQASRTFCSFWIFEPAWRALAVVPESPGRPGHLQPITGQVLDARCFQDWTIEKPKRRRARRVCTREIIAGYRRARAIRYNGTHSLRGAFIRALPLVVPCHFANCKKPGLSRYPPSNPREFGHGLGLGLRPGTLS